MISDPSPVIIVVTCLESRKEKLSSWQQLPREGGEAKCDGGTSGLINPNKTKHIDIELSGDG